LKKASSTEQKDSKTSATAAAVAGSMMATLGSKLAARREVLGSPKSESEDKDWDETPKSSPKNKPG
jgi:hypothetical protein